MERSSQELWQQALDRILSAQTFHKSKRLRGFIKLAVERASLDSGPPLKEYEIGVSVYERPGSFDPRSDGIVRVEATRLRHKLREYYESEGKNDPVRIELPRGSYMPVLHVAAPLENDASAAHGSHNSLAQARATASWRRSIWIASLACAAAVALAALLVGSALHTSFGLDSRSIAVLGFRNLSSQAASPDDLGWMDTALSEILASELSEPGRMRVVPVQTVARARRDLSIRNADLQSAAILRRIANTIIADIIVTGAYTAIGNSPNRLIRVDVWARNRRTGDAIAAVSESGPEHQLFAIMSRAGARLRAALGINRSVPAQSLPSAPQAMRLYAEGLDALRRYDPVSARPLLEQAVAADPSNALAYSALAECWHNIGYEAKARQTAQKSFELASKLGPGERLDVELRYRILTRDWTKAITAAQHLFELFPDDLESGLRLADVQYEAARSHDALATIAKLRKFPKSLADDAKLDMEQAAIYAWQTSDYRRGQQYAALAASKAFQAGSQYVAARALMIEGRALRMLGDPQAKQALEKARTVCEKTGDRIGVIRALTMLGTLQLQVNFAAAQDYYEQALQIAEEVGSVIQQVDVLSGIGVTQLVRGDPAKAEQTFTRTLALAQQSGNKSYVKMARLNVSSALFEQGRYREAETQLSEALAVSREIGEQEGIAISLIGLGQVAQLRGDFSVASNDFEQAVALERKIEDHWNINEALISWGDLLLSEGDVAAARRKYEQADPNLPSTQYALARLELASGDTNVCITLARRAAGRFEALRDREHLALTNALLAEALARQGDTREAMEKLASAESVAAHSQQPVTRFTVELVSSELRGNGRRNQAILRNAARTGLVPGSIQLVPHSPTS